MSLPLAIGYGNRLRQDDAVGCHAAELLKRALPPGTARVIECRQLTPELAPELESADLVILLDAALDLEPGRVAAKRIFGETQMVSSHDLSPAQLTGLAEALSGLQRPVFQITGGVCQTGFGESLTPGGERCARRMAEEAVKLLAVADLNPRGVQALGNQA